MLPIVHDIDRGITVTAHPLQAITRHIAQKVFHVLLNHPSVLTQLILSTARRAVQDHVLSGSDGLEGFVAAQTEKSGMTGAAGPVLVRSVLTMVARIVGIILG